MQPILKQILDATAPILATVITVFFSLLLNSLKAHVSNKTALDALNKLAHLAEASVLELQQTVVDDLKAAAEDGTITADEAAIVKDKAVARVRAALSTKGAESVMAALGYEHADQLDRIIETQVEAAVVRTRQSFGKLLSATVETKT